MPDLTEALKFSNKVADEVGRMALEHFRRPIAVDFKEDESPVTAVDRDIEAWVRALIQKAYPTHGIYGEEEAPSNLESDTVWVIDPIDGTKSFITGHPLFGGLMALMYNGQPCLGQIDMPAIGERWSGVLGQQTTFNGKPCRTRDCKVLSSAYVYTTNPLVLADAIGGHFSALCDAARLIRYGGDCYSYGQLASGLCDLVVEADLQPYDYLPVVQVVRGAGGVITDWEGAPLGIGSTGQVLAAATPELHSEVLDLIKSATVAA